MGHFSQKSPRISGSFAKNDLQLELVALLRKMTWDLRHPMSLHHSVQTYNTKEIIKEKARNSIKNLSIQSKEPNISFEAPHIPSEEPQSPSQTLHIISSKKSKHEPYIPSKET